MNKVLRLFLFFFLTISCSLDKKSGLWTKADKIENDKDLVIVELFKEEKNFNNEFNYIKYFTTLTIQSIIYYLKNDTISCDYYTKEHGTYYINEKYNLKIIYKIRSY